MHVSGGHYSGPKEIRYLFVDGASLHGRIENISKRFFGGQRFDVDFAKLKGRAIADKVFYYDAIPVQRLGEAEEAYRARTQAQRDRHERAAKVDGIHVYEGDARLRRKKLEQKGVDVMIAVDMLSHTFRRNMHKATLLTGDADFKPLVDALVREGMDVQLWYPVGETAQELLDAADSRAMLGFQAIQEILAKDSLATFQFPLPQLRPLQHPRGDKRLKVWGKKRNQELWQLGAGFNLVRDWDAANTYHVTHGDPEMIRAVCAEYPRMFSLPDDLF